MKPAKFDYILAESVDQVVDALDKGGGETIVLAGGQTLMPMLAMRLARPAVVVDINKVAELSGIAVAGDELVIKTCTRQAEALASTLVQRRLPLLAKAIAFVGHQQTRNRGTVGGSLSHADPASEIPLAALALDASVSLRSVTGTRRVLLKDYFLGPMMTTLGPDELITELRLPVWPQERRWAFLEFARRRGDFALAGIALFFDLDERARAVNTHIGVIGASDRPHRLMEAESVINGSAVDATAIEDARAGK